MVPDGDRHHRTQSARLENREDPIRDPNDHVVMEFVLDDHVDELGAGVSCHRPRNDGCKKRFVFLTSYAASPVFLAL